MAKRAVRYAVIDAFTDTPFKGNPAAVCILEDELVGAVDEEWMQSVAKEFNISETAFLARATSSVDSNSNGAPNNPRFNLRWFTPVAEVKLCGHGTLAAAHYLLSSGVVKCDIIEFVTKSGLLTAKKVRPPMKFSNNEAEGRFYIELDFPMVPVVECDSAEIPLIPETLNGAAMVDVRKTATANDLIVELASGNEVAGIHPKFDELQNCAGRGVIITGAAPSQSGFDFFTRFFCPKLGVNEDPVCGSAHCALAPYWSKKLGKNNLIAYMASSRGGVLDLQWEEETRRVKIRGEAVTVMAGTIVV
ncbi:uncharacterized isomerase BH0283-like [Phoenix dactylifera]|uniref:Uncharacterized isomerase BH0283-like n=1 Tax=Phoenix dactylifera TaxID=42345 RepID=A0A8B7CDK9_PHODC|nr:uncharacterized isomerase BH0283-like [Phoenix dactylifera]